MRAYAQHRRIASEAMPFMTHYAQASCTAGRAAFLTGQHPLRVGLPTVSLPGSAQGLQKEDPTIATMLKAEGYVTAQFGKTIWTTATSICQPRTASTNGKRI